MPAWRDFSFEDLRPWIGRLLLVDLDFSDGLDGKYRLCGCEWVAIFDSDLTGKRYKDVMAEPVRKRSEPYLSALFRERLIGYRVMSSFWFQRDFIGIEVLDLPLSDDGNKTNAVSWRGNDIPPATKKKWIFGDRAPDDRTEILIRTPDSPRKNPPCPGNARSIQPERPYAACSRVLRNRTSGQSSCARLRCQLLRAMKTGFY